MVGSSEAERSRLRAIVAGIGRELGRLPAREASEGADAPAERLRASFAELVDLLALGPEPELRECPACGRLGRRDATRCGGCWAKLSPPAGAAG
jgi:hypothetical protein